VTVNLKTLGERIAYRDGQMLAAQDLGDEKNIDDGLRWLHVRALHRTWGVVFGYEVKGTVGDNAVTVSPGYALDVEGREIILSSSVSIPVPAVTGIAYYVLTLNYAPDKPACCSLAVSQVSSDERPLFRWQAPQSVRFGIQVPLVTVTVSNGQIQSTLDFRVRRYASRLVGPHIVAGSTEPGRTGWNLQKFVSGPPGALNLTVDTSAAGFTKTPSYFAVLTGDFSGVPTFPSALPIISWPQGSGSASFLTPCGFISDATASSFTYKILPGKGLPVGVPKSLAGEAESRQWALHWIGVQVVDGCPPLVGFTRPFPFLGFESLLTGAM